MEQALNVGVFLAAAVALWLGFFGIRLCERRWPLFLGSLLKNLGMAVVLVLVWQTMADIEALFIGTRLANLYLPVVVLLVATLAIAFTIRDRWFSIRKIK